MLEAENGAHTNKAMRENICNSSQSETRSVNNMAANGDTPHSLKAEPDMGILPQANNISVRKRICDSSESETGLVKNLALNGDTPHFSRIESGMDTHSNTNNVNVSKNICNYSESETGSAKILAVKGDTFQCSKVESEVNTLNKKAVNGDAMQDSASDAERRCHYNRACEVDP
ncbi:hypothetical protein PoB_001838200 [Plakobranchus ocellatus]|uniref:Uncharacterized protein n=1 Tax=Plakobranchus ocellatus TaxID=259542 RepID=A0AAV3Z9G2_9GAST|nr:hypothetical protein PoB_001838200 [Plakobranchus ocellatus]